MWDPIARVQSCPMEPPPVTWTSGSTPSHRDARADGGEEDRATGPTDSRHRAIIDFPHRM